MNISTVFVSQTETAVRKPSLDTLCKFSVELNTIIDALIENDDIQTKYDEMLKLLRGKNSTELSFLIKIIKEIRKNTEDEKITIQPMIFDFKKRGVQHLFFFYFIFFLRISSP